MDNPSSNQGEPDGQPGSARWLERVGLLGISLALLVSSFLVWRSFEGSSIPGCGPGAGCNEVLSSKWSTLFGLPIALFGASIYGSVILAVILGKRPSNDFAISFGGTLILGGALWFFMVQAVLLRNWCPWCCAAHACASVGTISLFLARRSPKINLLKPVPFALGLVFVIGLALIQSFAPTRDRMVSKQLNDIVSSSPDASGTDGTLSIHGGQFLIDSREFPLIGVPNAENRWVAVSDFTCPYCQDLHLGLKELVSKHGQRLAVVVLPGSRDEEATNVHRLMLTLWHSDPLLYQELSEMISHSALAVKTASIKAWIDERMGSSFAKLTKLHAPTIAKQLEQTQRVMAENDRILKLASLPQLMLGNQVLAGEVTTATLEGFLNEPSSMAALGDLATMATHSISEKESRKVSKEGGKARIEFETTHLVTSEVARGETAMGAYVFTNTGNAPLTIENLKTSCGCTKVEGWEQTIAPGETGSFKIKFDSKRFTGKVVKSVIVTTNAANHPGGVVKLKVEMNVYSPVRESTNTASFGSVVLAKGVPSKTIRLTVTDGPIEFGTPTVTNPEFSVSLRTVEPEKIYELNVEIPNPQLGTLGGELILPVKHQRVKELRYPVYANLVHAVQVQPDKLVFGKRILTASSPRTIAVNCHDREHRNFKVTEISYTGSSDVQIIRNTTYKASLTTAHYQANFPVGFDPKSAIAHQEGIRIRTTHPDFQEIILPLE